MTTMEQLRIQVIAWYTHLPRDYETAKLFIDMLNDLNECRLSKSSVVADEDFDALVAQPIAPGPTPSSGSWGSENNR
jgi:hypothetical protein